jgi:hypothetical protein
LPELFLLQREEGRRALTTGRTDKRVEKWIRNKERKRRQERDKRNDEVGWVLKVGNKVFSRETRPSHALKRHDLLMGSHDILLMFYPSLTRKCRDNAAEYVTTAVCTIHLNVIILEMIQIPKNFGFMEANARIIPVSPTYPHS